LSLEFDRFQIIAVGASTLFELINTTDVEVL